ALGGPRVGMPVPELPQARSKKVGDGAFIPWEIIPPHKLQELTDYQIEGPNRTRFGSTTFQVSMNKARWDSLPADIKKAFDTVNSEAWVREVGDIWTRTEDIGIGIAKRRATSTSCSPRARWRPSGRSSSRWCSAGSTRGRRRASTARRSSRRRAS